MPYFHAKGRPSKQHARHAVKEIVEASPSSFTHGDKPSESNARPSHLKIHVGLG